MNVGPAFESDGEAPEFGGAGECALDDPAMLSEMTAALNALPGNAMLDAAFGASPATAGIVIPLAGMQLAGPMARPATLAMNGRNGVEQRIEHPAVMDVCAAEAHRQGNASPVRNDVAVYNLLNSAAALIGAYAAWDHIPVSLPILLVAVAAGGSVGAYLGSRHLSDHWLRGILASLLLVSGIKLVW